MKSDIHPKYYTDAVVTCSCGNTWKTGSTRKEIRTDVCSRCHPFYTGEQRIVDTEGQVDRFYKKIEARKQFLAEKEARDTARTSLERNLVDINISDRAIDALAKAGIVTVGQVLDKLSQGESTLLSVDGFGRKYLADLKKRLRQIGYEIPEAAQEITV
jgi:large subunit ribosomal protein L31